MKDIELKDLEALYDMEKNNYMMNQMVKEIDDTISKLGKSRNILMPKKELAPINGDYSCKVNFTLIFGIVGLIIGFVIFGIDIRSGSGYRLQLFIPIIGAIVGVLVGIFIEKYLKNSKYLDAQQKLNEKYDNETKEYHNAVKEDKERVQAELVEIDFLKQQRINITKQKQLSSEKLNNFYIAMEIDKDYRQLISIGYMFDFMRLGIATKLEGADGLYYLIRKELRYDQMQATMDEISAKLDTIIDQNSMIYNELKKIESKCNTIVANTAQIARNVAQIATNTDNINSQLQKGNEKLNQIQKSTEISNYILERTRKEQEYQNYFIRRNILN